MGGLADTACKELGGMTVNAIALTQDNAADAQASLAL